MTEHQKLPMLKCHTSLMSWVKTPDDGGREDDGRASEEQQRRKSALLLPNLIVVRCLCRVSLVSSIFCL